MLWFNTSGLVAKIESSVAASPRQSEVSTSTVVPGERSRTARIVAAIAPAPPVGQVVAGHAGHHRMAQPHARHGPRDAVGLVQRGGDLTMSGLSCP